MASKARRRKKRRDGGYQAPQRRGRARQAADTDGEDLRAPRTKRGGGRRERPPAPWGAFPLVELAVLLAITLMAVGFFTRGERGVTILVTGVALGFLAGLEISIREHFGGYRSHTTLLSAAAAAVTVVAQTLLLPNTWARSGGLLVSLAVFAFAFYLLRRVFKRRSGGFGFR